MKNIKILLQTAELLDSSDVMVAVYDAEDRLQFANRAFRRAWFIDDDEKPLWADIMRCNFHAGRGTVIRASDFDSWLRSTRARRGKGASRAFETDLHDGRWLWMTETVQPNGWMLCIATDITSIQPDDRTLRQDRDLAIRAAQTDELTGVTNRRFVMAKLAELLASCGEQDEYAGSIAVLDIDNFKRINDTFGHSSGDQVLVNFATTLQSLVRKPDVLGRVGGEEFMLVLPRTDPKEAKQIVDRMLGAVRQSRPLEEDPSFTYTFSAGIACAGRGEAPQDVYRRADLALYAAKLKGKDQVSLDLRMPDVAARSG